MPSDKKLPKYCGPHKHSGKGYAWNKGRQIYFPGKHGSPESLRGYRRFLESLLGERQDFSPRDTSVAELMECWLLENEPDISAKNYHHYLQCAKEVIEAGLADSLTCDFGPRKLKEFVGFLVDRGLARSTINQRISRLKCMFKWGVSEEMVPPDICHSLYSVRGMKSGQTAAPDPVQRRPVDWSRVEELDGYLSQTVVAMCRLQWLTGMRSENICCLRMLDVDISDSVWVYRPSQHKTAWRGKGLAVPLGPQGQALIEKCLGGRGRDEFVFRPCDSLEWHARNTEGFKMWVNRKAGEQFTPNTFRQAVMRAQARVAGLDISRRLPTKQQFLDAGWDPWTPYQLRHAAASRIRQGHSIEEVRAYMGHSTVQATGIYSEHDLATAKRLAQVYG